MAVNDVIRTVFYCRQAEQIGINVRYYVVQSETGPGANMQEIAIVLFDELKDEYRAVLSASAGFAAVSAQKVWPLPVGPVQFSDQVGVQGLVGGDPLPKQVSGLIKLTSIFGGRSGRGRVYAPFPGEDSSDVDGKPTAGYQTNLQTLGTALVAQVVVVGGIGSTTMNPCLFARATGDFTVLTGALARNRWATQRRRGDFGRPNPPL